MKTLSVFRTDEGIIVERKNEFGTKFKSVFEKTEAMLEHLEGYKHFGQIDEYQLDISSEFKEDVINFLNTGEMPKKHGGKREGAGRPAKGTTKKVSITMPDEIWDYFNRESAGNRSEFLYQLIERNMMNSQEWSNQAVLGYVIYAALDLGYPDEEIDKLVRAMYRAFDFKTLEEAKDKYRNSVY